MGMTVIAILLLVSVGFPAVGAALLLFSRKRRTTWNICAKCGYDGRASGRRCSECGATLSWADRLPRTGTQKVTYILGIAFLAAPAGCITVNLVKFLWDALARALSPG